MKHLLRKTFNVELIIPKRFLGFSRKKKIEIDIQQATIAEALKYQSMIQQQEHIPLSIIFLLEKYRGKKFTKKERIYLFSQAEELGKIRAQTFLYGTEREEIIPTKGEGIAGGPYSAFLISISGLTNTPIMKIIEEFTFEQLRDIANGGIRNANNITGEGKELNRGRARQRMFYEKHSKKEIEKLFKE